MALAGGIVAGLVLGGTGIGFAVASESSGTPSAASGSSTPTTLPGAPMPWKGRIFGPGRLGALGLGVLGGGVVHGTFTVRNGSGYKTVEVQTGTVKSVSSGQITVASPDGYTRTYTVVPATVVNAQAGGISSVSNSDQVTVTASPAGSKDTATNIVDVTKLKDSRQFFGFGPPGGPEEPPAPAPGTPGTAAA
jgi:hypothetical protein